MISNTDAPVNEWINPWGFSDSASLPEWANSGCVLM